MSSLQSAVVAALAITLLIGCTGPQPAQDASTSALLAQRPQGSTSYGLMKQGVGIGLAQLRCDAQELTLFLLGAGRGFC